MADYPVSSPRSHRDTTVYVGQLMFDTDERTVRKWFEAYGPVTSVKLISDKETGRSKGFGFVSFADERDARDALHDANGRLLDGATIRVNFAHGPPGPPMGGSGGGGGPPHLGRGRGRGGGYGGFPPGIRPGGPPPPFRPFSGGHRDRRPPSPARYVPRSRSRSRSPGRRVSGHDDRKRRRYSRSRSPSSRRSDGSRGTSPSSPSRSRSPAARGDAAPLSPRPSSAAGGSHDAAGAGPAGEAAPAPAGPQETGAAAAAPPVKPPPSAEAVKKELLRLRRQEKELGGRVRSLQDERERLQHQVARQGEELATVHAQLSRYREWVTSLVAGASKLASNRAAAAAAEAEAKRQEEALAALQGEIAREAERYGLHVGTRGIAVDDDAAWEALAAEIQRGDAPASDVGMGSGGGGQAADTAATAPAPVASTQQQAQAEERQTSDEQLQRAMQDAAKDEDGAAAGGGWKASTDDGSNGGQQRFGGTIRLSL